MSRPNMRTKNPKCTSEFASAHGLVPVSGVPHPTIGRLGPLSRRPWGVGMRTQLPPTRNPSPPLASIHPIAGHPGISHAGGWPDEFRPGSRRRLVYRRAGGRHHRLVAPRRWGRTSGQPKTHNTREHKQRPRCRAPTLLLCSFSCQPHKQNILLLAPLAQGASVSSARSKTSGARH
jgi:hypothetical protein